MSDDVGNVAEILGRLTYELSLVRPILPTYAHLIVSALFPIFAGAHASLSRPSSAAKPEKSSVRTDAQDDEDSEEEEEEIQRMEGLSPSDALMFPVLAGCTLAGLYFLIKWLQDPTLLNKILNWYFALFGVFSVSKLIKDALDFVHGMLFPRRYTSGGRLWHVHGQESRARAAGEGANKPDKLSPLPGVFSRLPLPSAVNRLLWNIREIPRQKWVVKLYIHKITALRAKISVNSLIAACSGIGSVIFFNTVSKPWFLTNLMGFGFSYGALQIMSPTTFATGSLILSALFFYDIYFVFYTPMMVTVAKSLDIPIKLVFPRPANPLEEEAKSSFAMLGLGDVVLPGIMIGLALRFDLYMFYLRKQKRASANTDGATSSEVIKANYTSVANRWGENFWTTTWLGGPFAAPKPTGPPTSFPKPYFYASLTGYIVGMLATLLVMHVFEHAQPALLYLVPGVLIFTWMTAIFRGELKEMWNFSEAVEDEPEEISPNTPKSNQNGDPKKTRQNQSFFSTVKSERTADLVSRKFGGSIQEDHERCAVYDDPVESYEHDDERKSKKAKGIISRDRGREIFSLSIEAPFKLSRPASIINAESHEEKTINKDGTVDEDGEPKDKRARHI